MGVYSGTAVKAEKDWGISSSTNLDSNLLYKDLWADICGAILL